MNHQYILEIPKNLDDHACSKLIKNFAEDILKNYFANEYKKFDNFTKMEYNVYVMHQIRFIKTNTKIYLTFDDKQLTKLI